MKHPYPHASGGFGAIAAIFVLVVLASLAAAIVRLGQSTQTGSAQDILGARAWAAARAGTEWGLYQALNKEGSWTTCEDASQTLDLRADTGVRVTVRCSSKEYNEGEIDADVPLPQTVRLYTIDAVACNSTSACPDNARAVQPGYIERRRQVQAVQ